MTIREKILDVSLDLLIEHGIHGTSTKMIKEQADISNGSLFHDFKTKDNIVVGLYKNFKQELLNNLYLNKPITDKDIIAYNFHSLNYKLFAEINCIIKYINTTKYDNHMEYIDFLFNQFWRSIVNF